MISELNYITVSLVSSCAVSIGKLRCSRSRDWSVVCASLNLASLHTLLTHPHTETTASSNNNNTRHYHRPIASRSKAMEVTAKPGADLLWAFQLHREHRALVKRLTAVEASAAQQQERITASKRTAHSDQHERVDALTERLRKLEDADVSEQVAGLASELRVSRQQLEQAYDKVKQIEKANKEVDSKTRDKHREIQARLGGFASVVTQTQNAVRALEGRLGPAVDAAERTAADGLAVFSERYEVQLGALSEQLRSLERMQGDLSTLVERDRRNHIVAAAVLASKGPEAPRTRGQDTTRSIPGHTQDMIKPAQSEPQAISGLPTQEKETSDVPATQRSSNIMPPAAKTPGVAVKKSTASNKGKRKRDFEKEISQLIHGGGSLTNAPSVLESQEPGTSTRGSKRLKNEAVEGRSLRSGFTQQVVPASKIKKESTTTRAKELAQPAVSVITGRKTAVRRSASKHATTATQVRKGKVRSKKAPAPKKPSLSVSSEIQEAHSPTPSASKQVPLPPTSAALALPLMSEEKATKQQEQRPKQRRRRIEQDDSMEEFLAKCEAAAEQ